ncbi:unnamed protein product [Albugo candida]|nr:unnamed protein product [Albugo candida]|eukprot:CCI43194.1 unnamed protein product [Albugo candida]
MGCVVMEHISHTVFFLCSPLIVFHFYPDTLYTLLGMYTAILSFASYIGHLLSSPVWIKYSRITLYSKGIILFGLASIGLGFFGLLLCQSFVQVVFTRIVTGIFTGVIPSALTEIDEICGNRQSHLATISGYVGIFLGALMTYVTVLGGFELTVEHDVLTRSQADKLQMKLYYYPFTLVSMAAWSVVVITMAGLQLNTNHTTAAYIPVASRDDFHFESESVSLEKPKFTNSSLNEANDKANNSNRKTQILEDHTQHAGKNVLGRQNAPESYQESVIWQPNPHFETIRSIIPHYYQGYTKDGHVVLWDCVGQIKSEKLLSSGFSTLDLCAHYRYFIEYALLKLRRNTKHIVYIIDLNGLTLLDTEGWPMEAVPMISKTLQQLFPGILYKLLVINAPVWFNAKVVAQVRLHVAASTLKKMNIITKDLTKQELLKWVGIHALPAKYGGKDTVELGQSDLESDFALFWMQTTGSLEKTKEIIGRHNRLLASEGYLDEQDSDEEAFFDCNEYGLQNIEQECDVVTSEIQHAIAIDVDAGKQSRKGLLSKKPERFMDDVFKRKVEARVSFSSRPFSRPTDFDICRLVSRQNPNAGLILILTGVWFSLQAGFDGVLPLWFIKNQKESLSIQSVSVTFLTKVSSHPSKIDPITSQVLMVTICMALTPLLVGLCRILLGRCLSTGIMTPLAILRLGLMMQIPIMCCFPLLAILDINHVAMTPLLVILIMLGKHLTGAIAQSALSTLLDHSIPADRRLMVYRLTHVISYGAIVLGGSGAPALFAAFAYLGYPFPFDTNALYFALALALSVLVLLSWFIPRRLNFPLLLSVGLNKK